MFKRGMNNIEKQALQEVKDSGLSYELRYFESRYSLLEGYEVAVFELKGIYELKNLEPFRRDLEIYTRVSNLK